MIHKILSISLGLLVLINFSCSKNQDNSSPRNNESKPISVTDSEQTQSQSGTAQSQSGTAINQTSTLLSTAESKSLSCIESICGQDEVMPNPYEIDTNIRKQSDSVINEQLKKPLSKFLGLLINKGYYNDIFIKQSSLQDFSKIELTPMQKVLLGVIYYSRKLQTYSPAIIPINTKEQAYGFDKKKLLAIDPSLDDQKIETIQGLLSFALNVQRISYNLNRLDLDKYIMTNFPNLSYKDALSQIGKTIVYFYDFINTTVDFKMKDYDNNLVLKKLLAGENLSSSEKKYIYSEYLTAIIGNSYIQYGEKFSEMQFDVQKIFSESYQDYLKSRTGQHYANRKTIREAYQKTFAACSEKMASSYAQLPSVEKLNIFKETLSNAIEASQKLVEERTKTSLAPQFAFNILYPQTKDDALHDWTYNLESNQRSLALAGQTIKNLDAKDPKHAMVALFNLINSDRYIFDEALAFCDKTEPAYLSDAAFPAKNLIVLSWPTVTYPVHGIGVIIHEIGHVVSEKFPQVVSNEISCLKQKYGSDQYFDEDFSDLFASAVTNKMQRQFGQIKAKNMGCALLPRGQKGWLPAKSLANTSITDSHSSGIYRLLAMSSMENEMTPQCRDYLNEIKSSTFDNYCRWQ